jgi:hypothetical protein
VAVRPYYLHQENSPRILPRATRHSTLKGCFGTLENGYLRVLMGTLLGTVDTVLLAWTKFWYEIGSLSFGNKLVDTIEAILMQERKK